MKETASVIESPITWIAAIIGGLIVSYLFMAIVTKLTPGMPAEKLVIPMIFYPTIWALGSFWLFYSSSTRAVLKKTGYSIGILALFLGACYGMGF